MLQKGFRAIVLTAVVLFITFSARSGAASSLPVGFVRETIAQGFSLPTAMAFAGDEILVTEKGGKIRVVLPDGTLRAQPYVTLSVSVEKERGLLGIALHPKYPLQPFVYVYYTTAPGALNYSGSPKNRVSRFRTVNGVGTAEEILLDNIPSDSGVHNAGDILFGFDNKLYIGVGDTGIERTNQSQDLKVLAGKILRIKANGKIPKDNPYFKRKKPRHEIYASGFRNPFRIARRDETQSYFVADVGWGSWEELDLLLPKGNFGWPTFEGPCPRDTICDPSQTDFGNTIPPRYYYDSTVENNNAIIGGAFASGTNYPAPYEGAYFFGDYAGWVHILTMDTQNVVTGSYAFDSGFSPTQFRIGPDKNLHVLDFEHGKIYRYLFTP